MSPKNLSSVSPQNPLSPDPSSPTSSVTPPDSQVLSAIHLQKVKFTYPQSSQPTLEIEELVVPQGQSVFIYGPSGSGKSTFLEIMSGVLVPQQGKVKVLGSDLVQLTAAQRDQFRGQKIGYIFQSFNLIPYLNVRENIELPLKLRGDKEISDSSSETQQRLKLLLQRLGLETLCHQSVSRLSVGQQQRVAVARALIGKPSLLFADEPTSALDAAHRDHFLKLVFELARLFGTTLVFVSHDRSLESLFDRSLSFLELNQAATASHSSQSEIFP